MKILTISDVPLEESQGSGYIILNYVRRLRERGHQVTLVGPETYEPFRKLRPLKRLRLACGVAWTALRHLCAARYDVVEFYGAISWLAVLLLKAVPGRRALLVQHSNGVGADVARETAVARGGLLDHLHHMDTALSETAFRGVDGLITVSEFERVSALRRKYLPASRIVAIENPLPPSYLGAEIAFSRSPRIGFCGTWIERKGVGWMEGELTKVLEEFPGAALTLVGVGEGFEASRYFGASVCSRIQVIPFVKEKEGLQEIYRDVSILVMPSSYESFGLVAAEAMANGCALVATAVGFPASLSHSVEALLIEPRPPQLYEAVKNLLLDEPLRLRIAEAGYRRVQGLNWAGAAEKLEAVYQAWVDEFRR